ncbi:hypothetical protein HAX54_046083, partial [Datura stramonium]|nr:hypothetical protein [Datura stramonium]
PLLKVVKLCKLKFCKYSDSVATHRFVGGTLLVFAQSSDPHRPVSGSPLIPPATR